MTIKLMMIVVMDIYTFPCRVRKVTVEIQGNQATMAYREDEVNREKT
jgi:hypothetical protein